MSSPPPGYNPETSQLQGGTDAPIAKVMGGGGGAPEGHNETQSLLQGGTDAPIVKMSGGGPKENAAADKAEAEADAAERIAAEAERKASAAVAAESTHEGDITAVETENLIRIARETKARAEAARLAATKARRLAGARKVPVTPPPPSPSPSPSPLPSPPGILATGRKRDGDRVTFGSEVKTENGPGKRGVAKTIQTEVYKLTLSDEDAEEIREFVRTFSMDEEGVLDKYQELVKSFKASSQAKIARYHRTSRTQTATIPTASDLDTEALPHKIVEVLPTTTSNIIIIPPINGNHERFLRSLEFLSENNIIDENERIDHAVIIFMAPFFGETELPVNQRLFYSFLHIKHVNPNSVFALRDTDTDRMRHIGVDLYKDIDEGTSDNYLLNYLNPSYIIFPKKISNAYEGIIFSSENDKDITIREITNKGFFSISDLLTKKSAFAFNAGGTVNDPAFDKYLRFTSYNDTTELPVSNIHVQACGTLKTVFDLEGPNPFQISSGDDIYVLRLETNKRPLLCGALMDDSDNFEGAELDPAFHTAPTIDVYVDGQKWKFRNPGYNKFSGALDKIASGSAKPESRNPVIQNWERAIFSTSEAEFLNHLNLTPRVLGMVFKTDVWKVELADFLNNLVSSECFEDTSILLKGSCEKTRVFLNKVYEYLFLHNAVKEDDLETVPLKIPSLPQVQETIDIEWPDGLEEIDDVEFEKETFGSIDPTRNISKDKPGDEDTYFMDLFVIHKKSFQVAARRLRLAAALVDTAKDDAGELMGSGKVFDDVLKDYIEDYPDFLFIY